MNDFKATIDREAREHRLIEIRREAEESGKATSRGEFAPAPEQKRASAETGYYGTPSLKKPQWTVEVPIYFFVGGLAGAASLIAAVGEISSADEKLIREARWLAAIGGMISPALLISDLGMPSRFLNMLRVFKIQSPMSVGSWTLVAFSNAAAATAVLGELQRRRSNSAIRIFTGAAQAMSALTGLVLSTYTGVLIGATAIPVWNEHVTTLPIHFAASGTGAAAAILELRGNKSEALNKIALGAAIVESAMGVSIEVSSKPSSKALKTGLSGWLMRGAGLLSGPVPLALRLLSLQNNGRRQGLRRAAAVSSIVGSILTRFAWVHAGKLSAEDSSVALQLGAPSDDSRASEAL
jgi:formate-dependent nitrite reductase membrane component NrfD